MVVVIIGEHQNDGEVVSGGRWRRVVVGLTGEGSLRRIEAWDRLLDVFRGYWWSFGGGGGVTASS